MVTVDKVIGISDEVILQLLHVHTRVVDITNFALPPSFAMFPDLEAYMRTYLCPAFEGAHARGQLCQIQFSRLLGARGSSSEDTALRYYSVENQFDDHGILTVCGEFVWGPPKQTWSTLDLDAPWEDWYQCFIPLVDALAEEAMES